MRPASTLLVFALLACSAGSERLAVLARPGEAGQLPGPERRVALAGETRPAFCLPAGGSFELPAGPRTRRVTFAVGLRGRGDAGPVRFVVRGAAPASEPLFAVELASDAPGWIDGRIELGGRAAERLHFSTSAATGMRACWASLALLGRDGSSRPNVLVVSLDTLGAASLGDVAGAGASISPAIDAFLDEGFRFHRAYAQYPATLTSHASLFSGRHPIEHGHYDHARGLDSLVSAFAAAGYRTAAFTENAYVGAGFGFARGFDRYHDGAALGDAHRALSGDASRTFDRAARWLETGGRDTRFFLFVHTYEVHAPYVPRSEPALRIANGLTPGDGRVFPPERSLIGIVANNDGGQPLDAKTLQRLRALHLGEVHELDGHFARFAARLRELGLENDTLVVVTSDHGEVFGIHGVVGHGKTLHEDLLRVPLGFRWPRGVVRGSSEANVELVDVMPTLLDLAGIALPGPVAGRSLAPLLRGEGSLPPRPATFAEVVRRGRCPASDIPCQAHLFSVRTERHRYVRFVGPEGSSGERLFDLEADPREERDLGARERAELDRHRALLAAHLGGREPRALALPGDADVDEATREKLRALGYLD